MRGMGRFPGRLAAAFAGVFVLVLGGAVVLHVLRSPGSGHQDQASVGSEAEVTLSASKPPFPPVAPLPVAPLPVVAPRLTVTVPAGAAIESMTLSPDGKTLADWLDGGIVQVRDAASGKVLATLNPGHLQINPLPSSLLAFSPDGRTLAVGVSGDMGFTGTVPNSKIPAPAASRVEIWDLASRKITATVPVPDDQVSSLAFSPNGRTLAVGAGRTLVLWSPATRASIDVPTDQLHMQGDAMFVSFSADSRYLAVANNSGCIQLWDVRGTRFTRSVSAEPGACTPGGQAAGGAEFSAVTISPDGTVVAAVGHITGDGSGGQSDDSPVAWLCYTLSGKITDLTATYPAGQQHEFSSAAFSPDGGLLAAGGDNGRVEIWNARTGQAVKAFDVPPAETVNPVAFSPDGNVLAAVQASVNATGPGQGTIQVWDVYGPNRP
jgi:WD40 repeat protein